MTAKDAGRGGGGLQESQGARAEAAAPFLSPRRTKAHRVLQHPSVGSALPRRPSARGEESGVLGGKRGRGAASFLRVTFPPKKYLSESPFVMRRMRGSRPAAGAAGYPAAVCSCKVEEQEQE